MICTIIPRCVAAGGSPTLQAPLECDLMEIGLGMTGGVIVRKWPVHQTHVHVHMTDTGTCAMSTNSV